MLIEHVANTLFGLLAHSLQFLIYGTYGFSAQNCFQISFPFVELAYGLTMSLDKTKEIAKILEKIVEILLWKTHGKLPIWLHKIVTSEGYVCLFFVHFECVSTFCMHSACHWAVSIICARECVCMHAITSGDRVCSAWQASLFIGSSSNSNQCIPYHRHTYRFVCFISLLLLLCVVERSLFFSNFFFHSQWLNMDFDRQTIYKKRAIKIWSNNTVLFCWLQNLKAKNRNEIRWNKKKRNRKKEREREQESISRLIV